MGKARIDRYGNTREQKLLNENRMLKRMVKSLRRELQKANNYDHIRDILEEHCQEERAQETRNVLENLKKVWKCHVCNEGVLEITIYSKLGESWYYRKCNGCEHRTPGKKYTSEVTGIFKQDKK
jgi:hypothetical protein